MSIKREVGKILGFTITGRYGEAFEILEKEGRITFKHIIRILTLLLERETEREQK
ncbi:MAG: hypothetical protein ACYSWS_03430 [Planctomycetota bacterium]|jgi:hypothetical protein